MGWREAGFLLLAKEPLSLNFLCSQVKAGEEVTVEYVE
jgi:hypothetical protein